MKKKKIKLLSIFLLLAFVSQGQSFSYPDSIALDLIQLPTGEEFTEDILDDSTQTVLVIFNPKCGHCIDFIDSTLAYYDELPDHQFLFVFGNLDAITMQFVGMFNNKNLAAYDRFHFGKSTNDFFDDYMISYMPSVYLYNDGGEKFVIPIHLKDHPYSYFLDQLKKNK